MGDHFWPSVYPGLAIGLLYGLAAGGQWRGALLGAAGGMIAAALSFVALGSLLAEDGLLPMLAMVGLSLAGAWGMLQAARLLGGRGASHLPP